MEIENDDILRHYNFANHCNVAVAQLKKNLLFALSL